MIKPMKDFQYNRTSFDTDTYEKFDVKGAGTLIVGNTSTATTGGVEGFSIGVQWGAHGYAGGVLSKDEAIKLAKHIMRTINLDELGV